MEAAQLLIKMANVAPQAEKSKNEVKHVFKETNPMEVEQKINLIKPKIAVKRAKATANKSPSLKKPPTSGAVKGMGEKRERTKKLPKAPQTVEVFYRIF